MTEREDRDKAFMEKIINEAKKKKKEGKKISLDDIRDFSKRERLDFNTWYGKHIGFSKDDEEPYISQEDLDEWIKKEMDYGEPENKRTYRRIK